MSTLRRLALAGAFALPISLVAVAPSSAGTFDGPYEPWTPWSHFETSGSYAGIGGAATTDTEGGSDWWGHHWSESDGAYAGIGGAAVTHSEESGTDDTDWDDGDDDNGGWNNHHNTVTHHVQHHAVSHPDPVDTADHVTYTQPAADTDDDDDADDAASYVQEAHWAGADGASSAHIASHAGDHYATYDSGHLTAGPGGASSEGVHALAVPGYAGYHNWYTAAGAGGTAVHSVTAEADADTHDHGWQDYDSYDS
ncbi:hypothetical protein SAMN05421837_107193 [Amycolatopsis pretoriensis]|uniref:Uncharacterized protein n=1 Tax=Amycolatopsis pretoriensis TaxID=218821 RepID=A0A1H5R6P2_9PSEU|nr:hypothetical protein [Amycolatopsis pretoriensis]SEF34072.1 hypothetical protein SAMN05421837_107193 [Amycolatopsis pretoriensis]